MHTAWRSDGLSTHSLDIRWTKHTKTGDPMDYAHGLEIRWAKHTHTLNVRWTMHIQTGDPMNFVYTNWRQAGCIHVTKLQMTQLQCVCGATNHTGLVSYKQT